MIISGYMASVSVVTTVKWFWFLFGIGMFVPVIYSLARTFRETVIMRKDPEIMELYGKVAWLTIIIWCFYPIVWLFSEGFASFSVSFEVWNFTLLQIPRFLTVFICISDLICLQTVALTIMDVVAKCAFSFMISAAHENLGPTGLTTHTHEIV